ncbi:hypothetical protein C0993_008071 [Termitomyces sp. T159_Od127]|nr:hypothetical protein C0993_008071 [Termitomyces sp. T159_Od127]
MASTTSNASIPAYMLPGEPAAHPSHLEGDPSLATEILPGPPSLVSIQQSMLKRDPKKPSQANSYLFPTDPGSTYSGIMHGTLIGHEQEATRLKRTKSAIGRAQRASARNQNGTVSGGEHPVDSDLASASSLNPIPVDLEPDAMIEDEPSISRSNSSQNLQDTATSAVGRPKRKDQGKGKETAVVRVKEEPRPVSLHTPDPPQTNSLNNDDHCSSCRSHGALVYCDGCPRAFHLWCLDPPMESVDEGDSRWFCPGCTIRKHPPRKPPPSLLAPLIHQVDNTIPKEFQLPEDVRTFFRDVGSGPKGTYVETSELKPPRLNANLILSSLKPAKHRIPKQNATPIEITKPKQYNNGNIEVTHPIAIQPDKSAQKVAVDEVLINGRRYRVPERVIVLDFWNKLNKSEPHVEKYIQIRIDKMNYSLSFRDANVASAMSSPLTSLSSLDDDDQVISDIPLFSHDYDDLKVAQWVSKGYPSLITDTAPIVQFGGPTKIDSLQNIMLLRNDLHSAWDNYELSVDPDRGHIIVPFVAGYDDVAGKTLELRHITDPTIRPLDELFRDHFLQAVLKNMKGAGEPSWDYEDALGGGRMDLSRMDIWGSEDGREHLEFELAHRFHGLVVAQED